DPPPHHPSSANLFNCVGEKNFFGIKWGSIGDLGDVTSSQVLYLIFPSASFERFLQRIQIDTCLWCVFNPESYPVT
ncbi:hypothetical protein, partial [Desulfovibrio inopinatus]|uniref:hypothetical protein n=1 Tax=Desulfovibrio inopinatus TaxID=102109 RepID=UPI0004860206